MLHCFKTVLSQVPPQVTCTIHLIKRAVLVLAEVHILFFFYFLRFIDLELVVQKCINFKPVLNFHTNLILIQSSWHFWTKVNSWLTFNTLLWNCFFLRWFDSFCQQFIAEWCGPCRCPPEHTCKMCYLCMTMYDNSCCISPLKTNTYILSAW